MVYRRRTTTRKRPIRRKRTQRRKFTRNRRYNRSRITTTVSTGRSVIANRYLTKLVYGEAINLQSPGGGTAVQYYQFKLNDLFDPDLTGVGHQPRGFDQLTTLYQRYLVYGCKVIVEGKDTGTNANSTVLVVNAYPNNGVNNTPGNIIDALEDRMTYTKNIDVNNTFRFSKYYDMAHLWGATKSQLRNEENYSASTNTSPNKTGVVAIGIVASDGTVTALECTVTLVYYCAFYSPLELGQS